MGKGPRWPWCFVPSLCVSLARVQRWQCFSPHTLSTQQPQRVLQGQGPRGSFRGLEQAAGPWPWGWGHPRRGSFGERSVVAPLTRPPVQGLARTWAEAASWSPLRARTSCWTAGCTWASATM